MRVNPLSQQLYLSKPNVKASSNPNFKAVYVNNRFTQASEIRAFFEKSFAELEKMNIPLAEQSSKILDVAKQLLKEAESPETFNKYYEHFFNYVKPDRGFLEFRDDYDDRCDAVLKKAVKEANEKARKSVQQQRSLIYAEQSNFLQTIKTKIKDACVKITAMCDEAEERLKKLDKTKSYEHFQQKSEYLNVKNKHNNNKSFSRIAGYQEEKDLLQKYFIDEIKREQSGETVEIPDSILFYGPTGMGKSTFYKAFAETSDCNLINFKFNNLKDSKTNFERLKNIAIEAEEHYQNTKQRSIIYIDEITRITSSKTEVIDEMKDFLNTCSKKYHCTIFASTNSPHEIKLPLSEDNNIFPYRVMLDPPTFNDKVEILKYYLKERMEKDTDYNELARLIEEKEKSCGNIYSINRIKDICLSRTLTKALSLSEFKDAISRIEPNVTKEELQYYKEQTEVLLKNFNRAK